MAKTIPHRELRNHSSDVLRRVQAGETIQVANHAEVVAVLSPATQGLTPRVVVAKQRGGFATLPRLRSPEAIRDALDALRSCRGRQSEASTRCTLPPRCAGEPTHS